MSSGWFAVMSFAGASGFYLLLAGSLTWTELAATVLCAGATAAFMTIQRLRQNRQIALVLPPVRILIRTVTSLVTDTGLVGLALFRAIPGSPCGAATRQTFHPGGRSPHDAGRRALVTLLTSLAPNGFVLDMWPSALAEADHALLLHRLAPAPPLSGADWPT